MARQKRLNIHYVNNAQFSQAVVDYCTLVEEAKKDGKEIPVNVQIANYLKAMRLIEQEVILRKYVRSSIITEAMSKSDRDEVRRIARSEMDRYYKEDIKPKVTKEVEKLLKEGESKATKIASKNLKEIRALIGIKPL